LMRTEGLKPAFPWLPLTILNPREFYDHHFLFHVALIPFTFGDLRLGAKWASVIFSSLAFLSVWWLLYKQRVQYSWLWALGLLAVSEAFIYRMSIPRAQSLSLAVLALGFHWLLNGKPRRLALLGFAYVWLYNAFPLLLGVAGAYVLAAWVVERRLVLRPLLYTGAGFFAGMLLNPYFPHNIVFGYQHILPKLFEATSLSVGNEWYPYDTSQLLRNSPLALAALAGGAFSLGLSGRRMSVATAASFLLACLFGLMVFQSRRFIEYFPAFALIFIALASSSLFNPDASRMRSSAAILQRGVRAYSRVVQQYAPALALAIVLIPGLWLTFNGAKTGMQGSKPYTLYGGASHWLATNTPAGTRVFQTDWDDFPRLFFYNTSNTYLVGLDPTYLQFYDASLYNSWVQVTRGYLEQPSQVIWGSFGARYVLSDLQHVEFLDKAAADPGLVETYRDNEAVVFQVLEPFKPLAEVETGVWSIR